MSFTPGQLAADILHLHVEQTSRLSPKDWVVNLPDDISVWMMTRAKVRQAGMGSYLLLQVGEQAASFPAAMKKVCKAGALLPWGRSLESVMMSMLLEAVLVDRQHTRQLLGFVHQCLKTNGKALCRAFDEYLETRRDQLFRGSAPQLLKDIEINRETIGPYSCVLLLGLSGVRDRVNSDQAFNDLLNGLIRPLFDSSVAIGSAQVAHALRLILKHSEAGSRGVGLLVGAQLNSLAPGATLSAEATAFMAQIFSDPKVVQGTVFRCIHEAFQALKQGDGAAEQIAERARVALLHISAACNKQHLDNAIVSGMKTISRSSQVAAPKSAGAASSSGWSVVVNGIMAGAWNAPACWWSILNQQDSIHDYLNLQKSKNAILRSALGTLNLNEFSQPFMHRFAELAILGNYHEKSINLLVHAMPDGQKVLQDVYKLVGDPEILGKMDGSSRREVLIHDLDL